LRDKKLSLIKKEAMKQKFNCSPLAMLMASLTVADHFDAEKEIFVNEDPRFADPFSSVFRESVNNVLVVNYGINSREALKQQTIALNEQGVQVHDDLKMIKIQIERGFRSVAGKSESILDKLGFTAFWSKASNYNQAMLTSLLLAFRNNLNPELRAELEQNGVNPKRVNRLLAAADSLTQANIAQETLKGIAKLDTGKTIQALNDIYDRVMDICAIGQELFKNDKLKKDLFVFGKLVKQQSATGATGKPNNDNGDKKNESK